MVILNCETHFRNLCLEGRRSEMTSIYDVAKYILNKLGAIDSYKLQKLCYYTKAWSLALGEGSLFPEKFEAWVHGPVSRELFQEHKGAFRIHSLGFHKGNARNISEEQKDVIEATLVFMGGMSGKDLEKRTHDEDPWVHARIGVEEEDRCSNIIDEDLMKSYYANHPDCNQVENLFLLRRAERRYNDPARKVLTTQEVLEINGLTFKDIINAEDVDFEIESI